jgi:hydrogenase nickel incorporation protein HypA/HybF
MHELSVCLALVEQAGRIADEHGARGIARIEIRIGPLSGVEPRLLRNAFPLAAAGTLAEHAELVIEDDAIRVACMSCGAESTASANRLLCASCGDYRTRLLSGDAMVLDRLELDGVERHSA